MPNNSEKKIASNNRWVNKTYDKITFVVPKGAKDKIKQAAEMHPELTKVAGQPTSINRYIENAVNIQLQQDGFNIDD